MVTRTTRLFLMPALVSFFVTMLLHTACGNAMQVQIGFYDYLNSKVTKALQLYTQDLPKFQAEVAKIGSYESELKSALRSKSTTF
jgi:hypothetical protein